MNAYTEMAEKLEKLQRHHSWDELAEAATMLRKLGEKKPQLRAVWSDFEGRMMFLPLDDYAVQDEDLLYAAPVPVITAEQKAEARQLRDWATTYLATGGLFNPENAQHRVVSDLIRECRDYLDKIGGQYD